MASNSNPQIPPALFYWQRGQDFWGVKKFISHNLKVQSGGTKKYEIASG
jgi:hypothetical protein